jgi:hypothetical protein
MIRHGRPAADFISDEDPGQDELRPSQAEVHESLSTNRVLEELVRFNDDKMVAMISPQLEKVVLQSLALQDQPQQFMRAFTLPCGTPGQAFQQMAEQYRAFTEAFKAAAPAASESKPKAGPEPDSGE